MAFRCSSLLKVVKNTRVFRHHLIASSSALPSEDIKKFKPKIYKTEDNLVYLEDQDSFGNLSKQVNTYSEQLEDEDDIKEEKYLQNTPLSSQKLTTKQYADLIKQYLKHKRLKEAIDVLEVRMLKEDITKPVNYIYNILIGACADVGYTKKAFKLFNDMKRRSLKPTGDTFTNLFNACANSPWPADGLKNALHLRELMNEKGIEPNLTNYNAMIKAFGWCGDLPTAFQIVDEMIQKRIKIRVHTFNHLLHACISDKTSGLRHALIVWRKMLKMRERPNIYTFNLMLKCVKDCNLGGKQDIIELIDTIQTLMPKTIMNNRQLKFNQTNNNWQIEQQKQMLPEPSDTIPVPRNTTKDTTLSIVNKDNVEIEFVNKLDRVPTNSGIFPNLLSKDLHMEHVTALQEVHTLQDKFAVIGGQDDFLKEMEQSYVKPNIKTFTQMLPLLDNTTEAEAKLLETMKSLEIHADIDFYNMLIKKRCLRLDYKAALDVKQCILEESEYRKKRYPHSKKLKLKMNIMTYGVLAMACDTKDSAEDLLNEMNEKKIKLNIEILGALLRQGIAHNQFGYLLYIMKLVKQENIQLNDIFLKHLERFNDKCQTAIKKKKGTEEFKKSYQMFSKYYNNWLKDINIDEVLKSEHPWEQFKGNHPVTLQHDGIVITQPKKFYKKNRKYVKYVPKIVN